MYIYIYICTENDLDLYNIDLALLKSVFKMIMEILHVVNNAVCCMFIHVTQPFVRRADELTLN